MEDYILYIIRHLIPELSEEKIKETIGYTSFPEEAVQCKIIFIPSGFFNKEIYGTGSSLPVTPLKMIEDIPLLYGKPFVERINGQLIIHADIIASSYFLLSRYEEYVKREVRDIHGRFPGNQSLPYKENFIHRPIVEEYGNLLKRWLKEVGIELPRTPENFHKIYFTHDVDVPFLYRRTRSLVKSLFSPGKRKTAFHAFFGKVTDDPAFTFPWLFKRNKGLSVSIPGILCETILFLKAGGKKEEDKPFYKLWSKDIQYLLSICKEENITIGLHASYDAGLHPSFINEEKRKLEEAAKVKININRYHYLCSREPEDLLYLILAGIKEDFTMGYADVAGFRLGTCRPVYWINPADRKVHPLLLHPMPIMECTLLSPDYMQMNYNQSLDYCKTLINQVQKFNGNLVLLWHNNNVATDCLRNRQYRELYKDVLKYIRETQKADSTFC